MERRSDLYSTYKRLEEEAFKRLCKSDDRFLAFRTRDLVALSENPVSKSDKEFILKNLTRSIRLRNEIAPFFKTPCRRHKHFIAVLRWIVGNLENTQAVKTADQQLDAELQEMKAAREVGVAGQATYAANSEFLDRTLDSNGFLQFLDELEAMVGMICDVWRRARGETLYSAAVGTVSLTSTIVRRKKLILFGLFVLVSTCVYHEIKSSIGVAEMLSAHWFHEDGSLKDIAPHSFHQDLKDLGPLDNTILKIFTISHGAPGNVIPEPVHDAMSCKARRSGELRFQVVQHILKDSLPGPSEDLRKSTAELVAYSFSCPEDLPNVVSIPSNEDMMNIKAHPAKCIDILSLGQLYTSAVSGLVITFRMALDTPLIPMLIHLYLAGRLCNGCECEEDLDVLCQDGSLQPVLFWNGLPTTMDALMKGVKKWIVVVHHKAQQISQSRYREPIVAAISNSGGLLNKNVIERLGTVPGRTIWETLETRLEEESLFLDTVVMRESILKTAQALSKRSVANESAATVYLLSLTTNFNDDSKTFLKCFMSNWKKSRKLSIAPGEIKKRKTPA